jgi:hypothetical protein
MRGRLSAVAVAALPAATRGSVTEPAATPLVNVARNRPAQQSSVGEWSQPNDAGRAVSGRKDGRFAFCTAVDGAAYWQVDLQSDFRLRRIMVFNREDACADRAVPLVIEASTNGRDWHWLSAVHYVFGGVRSGKPLDLHFAQPVQARYIRLRRNGEARYFHLDQVEIYAALDEIGHHAQLRQDLWVLAMTGGRAGGSFVEIGSADGVSINNT